MKKLTLSFVFFIISYFTIAQAVNLDIKVFLEGPFNGSEMNTDLYNAEMIPLSQPYNAEPWNYEGTESVVGIPNEDVVDWVLVELRETSGIASTALSSSVIDRQACFLLKNGQIVDLDGVSLPEFNLLIVENLYVVIWQRNHLAIMTATPLIETIGTYSYDFTDAISKSFMGRQKEIGQEIYGMIAGDCDGNGIIDHNDKNNNWSIIAGNKGYELSDLNLNAEINNIDKDDFWNVNIGLETKVPHCGELLTDSRDGQQYETVQIGTQCWMAENLNIGSRIDGVIDQTDNLTIEKYCYNDIEDSCMVYGGLYQWIEMMEYVTTERAQGICPEGWYIPTDDDLKLLEGTVDSQFGVGNPIWDQAGWRGFDAGKNLKSLTGWASGGNGTDSFGFATMPGGWRTTSGFFATGGTNGYFWTSSVDDVGLAIGRDMAFYFDGIDWTSNQHANGFSIRCIKDYNQVPSKPSIPLPEDSSIDISIYTTLSWFCSDPDGEPITYNIYFGTEINPSLVEASYSDTTYSPGQLNQNTTYYWKIVANGFFGNSTEGEVWSFTTKSALVCGEVIIDVRDGQVYNTVQIGDQCWMAENMNIGTRITDLVAQTDNSIIEKYCYNNSTIGCNTRGGLYQWDEMMQYSTIEGVQGICTPGWRLPTDEEWKELEGMADSQYGYPDPEWDALGYRGFDAGLNLKSTSGWSLNGNGTDLFGFTVVPAGSWDWEVGFEGGSQYGNFWSSTETNATNAWFHALSWGGDEVFRGEPYKANGYSVRCLYGNQTPFQPSNPSPENGSTNQAYNTNLSWTCSDPENDPLIYEVYFGETNPPGLYAIGQTTNIDPGSLNYNTTYYWKIIVHDDHTNSNESPVWNFTTGIQTWWCGDTLLDTRDSQAYTTVQIGTQCWMAENLNIGTMINGNIDQDNNSIIEKYCYYNSTANCDIYGGLYSWNEMMQYTTTPGVQGICPDNWNIPTDAEWTVLTDFLGGESVAGGKIKTTGTIEDGTGLWYSPNTGATNSSGFTGPPGGGRHHAGGGYFYTLGQRATFWTSTVNGTDNAWSQRVFYNNANADRNYYLKIFSFSVRCIQD